MHHKNLRVEPLARVKVFVRSVRFRLTVWFGIILGLVLLTFSVLVYSRQVSTLEEQLNNRLQDESLKLFKLFDLGANESNFSDQIKRRRLLRRDILLSDSQVVIQTWACQCRFGSSVSERPCQVSGRLQKMPGQPHGHHRRTFFLSLIHFASLKTARRITRIQGCSSWAYRSTKMGSCSVWR
jgi:hypothetical protein